MGDTMLRAVLCICAGPKENTLREARKTIQLLQEPAPGEGDKLGQPISRASAFSIIRRRHREAQAAAATGGCCIGASCGASLTVSLVFLRDRLGLNINLDRLVCDAAAPTPKQ
eukprot:6196956-Pleurochrysis_carterae.AAC.1